MNATIATAAATCRDGTPCHHDSPACPFRAVAGLCALSRRDPAYRALGDRLRATGMPAHPATFGAADPRPRACLVSPCLNVGGADRWMLALMAETRHAVAWTAVALVAGAHVVPSMHAEASALAPVLDGPGAIDAAIRASGVVVSWGVVARDLADRARRHGVPLVAVSHGVGEWTRRLYVDSGRVAVLAGVSRATLRTFPEDQRGRVRLIENCAEPGRLEPRTPRAEVRAAWGIAPGEKALVMVGRLSSEKNPEAIADAVAELHRRGHAEWRGVHVGDGWGRDEAEAHAEAVAPGLVRFPGVTGDVAAAMLAADALCQPSREEACGLAILEAWWVGVPMIAARVGLAEEDEAATLVRITPPGCSGAELADAVLADAADPEGTAGRAGRAKAAARARFGPTRFGREWADLVTRAAAMV